MLKKLQPVVEFITRLTKPEEVKKYALVVYDGVYIYEVKNNKTKFIERLTYYTVQKGK